MIPGGALSPEITTSSKRMTSRTYKLDKEKNTILGFTDGLDAIEQAIYKILNTERYEEIIYGFNYGVEFQSLIGKDYLFVKADIKRRIEEALLQDDRIESIGNFSVIQKVDKDEVQIQFDAITVLGLLHIEREVRR